MLPAEDRDIVAEFKAFIAPKSEENDPVKLGAEFQSS
jgi:hypothetical protein